MIATGQSGNPLSHLYGNLTLRWRDGQTVSLAPDVIDAALVAALAAPPLNLRQGTFTRRTRQTLDWKTLRRSGVLAGLILIMLLATTLVRVVRLHADTVEIGRAHV